VLLVQVLELQLDTSLIHAYVRVLELQLDTSLIHAYVRVLEPHILIASPKNARKDFDPQPKLVLINRQQKDERLRWPE